VRKSFAQLRAFDADSGERIPTLREVFETVERRAIPSACGNSAWMACSRIFPSVCRGRDAEGTGAAGGWSPGNFPARQRAAGD